MRIRRKKACLSIIKAMALSVMYVIIATSCVTSPNEVAHFRREKLDEARSLLIAKAGNANVVIAVSPDAGEITMFAAQELKTFLDKSLKTNIPILTRIPEDKPAIIVGDCDLARKAGIDVDKLPRDGFYIKTVGKNVFIAGRDNSIATPGKKILWECVFFTMPECATLFGVYDFLERFVGIRFYFPSEIGTVIPQLNELRIPCIDIVEAPDFTRRRYWRGGECRMYEGIEPEKGMMLNYLRTRMATDYIPNCHALRELSFQKRFGDSHPEYFALLANGKRNNKHDPSVFHQEQLCYTGGLQEEIYKDAKTYLTGKPSTTRGLRAWTPNVAYKKYFSLMPQDGYVRCLCETCGKYKGQHSDSDIVWDMTCDVAEKLEEENIEGYITQLAYCAHKYVPKRKIPDNVLVQLAVVGPWASGKMAKVQDKLVVDWTEKLGHKIWLWNYAINYKDYGLPGTVQMTPAAVGRYYQEQAPYIDGAFLESETSFFIFNYLNWYVFGKVCWNNKTDVQALLDEHFHLMFDAGQDQMKTFYEELEKIWINDVKGNFLETNRGPVAVTPSRFDLWERYYSPQKLARFNELFDKAEKLTAHKENALKRIKFMRTNLLNPMLETSKKYFEEMNVVKTWTVPVKQLATGEKLQIDGKLDDLAWEKSDQTFLLPFKSDNCEVKTITRILKDSDNLYLAFNCEEPEVARIKAQKREADDGRIWKDSCVEIHLNPSGDHKNMAQMIVNAIGSAYQKTFVKKGAEATQVKDWLSNAVIKTNIDKNRWTAEIAIPLKSLGKIGQDGFPANFIRTRGLTGDAPNVPHYSWSPFIKRNFNEVENFGTLDFNLKKVSQIIDNGNFTAIPTNNKWGEWIFNPSSSYNTPKPGNMITLDESTFMKGGKSLKICSQGGFFAVEQRLRKLKPNTKYRLSFYLKSNDIKRTSPSGGIQVQIYCGKKSLWFPKLPYFGTLSWRQRTFEFSTDADTKNAGIKLWIRNAKGAVWFDDVNVREISE